MPRANAEGILNQEPDIDNRQTKMAGTQVPAIFACMMIYPAIFRGELLVQMVPSSSRVTASVPFTFTRAGSSA